MTRKLAQRLDRLERDFAALLTEDTSPIYLREGEPVPDGIDPRRGKGGFPGPGLDQHFDGARGRHA